MKFSLEKRFLPARLAAAAALALSLGLLGAAARGELPAWIHNLEANSALETAFFRSMDLPGGPVLHRRPPGETRPELEALSKRQPQEARIYSLLALEAEQQLDFNSAETHWKKFVEVSGGKNSPQLALADFYHRRLRPEDEIRVLSAVASSPAQPGDALIPPARQQSWRAFERIFGVIRRQGLAREISISQYQSWLMRYPAEASLYARFLDFLIAEKQYDAASQLIADYARHFPGDEVFPVRARGLLEFRRGSLPQGLAVYEQSFQPLWNPELVKSYFDLLQETHSLRKFLDQQHAALNANPEDLRATSLLFYYYQQQGKLDAALAEITRLRLRKESARSEWAAGELFICARLLEAIHQYPESARYYFALYSARDAGESRQAALAGMVRVLLDAPEMPIRFGSGDLSLYRDIATQDQGPGFWNGILSLLLNSTDPAGEYAQEEQRAVSYFHRSRAAELLAVLDAKFPASPDRAELHARLVSYYAGAGESQAVIRTGKSFLAAFPQAPERTQVALLMADAYARESKSTEEFAVYDAVLKELAAGAQGVPLGDAGLPAGGAVEREPDEFPADAAPSVGDSAPQISASEAPAAPPAFQVAATPGQAAPAAVRSPEYSRVLEHFLARLAQLKQIPQAIAVLRNELERNPDDPGLYDRLAVFLQQNRIEAEQEDIYKGAIARFPQRSWYGKLARYYLRRQQVAEFTALTESVVKLFQGTELEVYFREVVSRGSPGLYLQLNLYAHRRFPHNLAFVRNLLGAYLAPETRDLAAWERLLREHWFEDAGLRNEFFSFLSRTRRLEAELQSLRAAQPAAGAADLARRNPAAGEYLAQAEIWRSHYEESAPCLQALAALYPADPAMGHTAASVFRSLAGFDPAATEASLKIQENLLAASPGSSQLLAQIGDTLADRRLFPRAAPYWDRIPQIAPGDPHGYLDAATIFWDYFDFDHALRLIQAARGRFHDPALYAYEAGAIYEGKRSYPRAIAEYVEGSLAGGSDSPAEARLLQLARRPAFRSLVDTATQERAQSPGASIPAIALRVRVLETLDRKQDLAALLDAAVARAATLEEAVELESLAQQRSLDSVREHALEKQVSLTSDPVTRLQLRYRLVQLDESRKDLAAARRNIEELYSENPKILGVVRATVDFYWRARLPSQSIAVLQQAARDAYPALAAQFSFEAARKSTDARLYPQARALLSALLKDSPYNAQYLAAMADTFAREADQAGLRRFYADEIAALQAATLPPDAKKTQLAALRRGLIPALTALGEFPAAVDQYIEILNAFPADDSLAAEAALYAARYRLSPRLVDFYSRTVQQSPRDERWAVLLARIYTTQDDLPSALDAYGKAIAVRPDRVDLRIARGGLEERLMRLEEAAADYSRLYDLAYKDPQWMEKLAAIRVRQGRPADAATALKIALVDPQPERPAGYFEAARRLDSWGLLSEARGFAESGLRVAGPDLLASPENHAGAALYARLLTRLRQQEAASLRLQQVLADASSSLPVLEQQAARQGIAAVTDSEWRRRVLESRIQSARNGLRAAFQEMGRTAAAYFTPEERLSFADFARKLRQPMSPGDAEDLALPLAESAGLSALEAQWRFQLASEDTPDQSLLSRRIQDYARLQRSRLRFAELAPQLEQFALRFPPNSRTGLRLEAAQAFRSAGDSDDELRVLAEITAPNLSPDSLARYFELLLQKDPQSLVRVAAVWSAWGEQAAQYAVVHGSPELVHQVVAARSRPRTPVWRLSYDALAGLYFSEFTPAVAASFLGALGDQTIGERIGKPLSRDRQLAGAIWFYYGSRYGEYLGAAKQEKPEDFLAAVLEESPASPQGYLQLADYYAAGGDSSAAITDYQHALELAPASVATRLRLARAWFQQGDHAAAVREWKQAVILLSRQVDRAVVPEDFWTDFAALARDSSARHLFPEIRPEVDALLRAYLHRNGNYRSNELLKSAYTAAGDPATATAWLLDLSSASGQSTGVLADVAEVPWIPLASRAPIYQRVVSSKKETAEKLTGTEKEMALADLWEWQIRWANYLFRAKQFQQADSLLGSLPQEARAERAGQLVALELQLALRLGSLDAKLAAYQQEEEKAPSAELLRAAAQRMRNSGDPAAARKVLAFVFTRELARRNLAPSNFLGLAEIRLAAGDTAEALQLLRRLAATVGTPYENLDPAAALLEKTGHFAEAAELLSQLSAASPWDSSVRLRLAKAAIAAGKDVAGARAVFSAIARQPLAPYAVRVEAARALAGQTPSDSLGSAELEMLAAPPDRITTAAADQAFFYFARLRAAARSAEPQAQLLLLRHFVEDFPSSEEARFALFEAAASAHSDTLAIAALDHTSLPALRTRVPQRAEESEEADQPSAADGEAEASAAARSSPSLSRVRQALLCRVAADVLERLDRLPEALGYLDAARKREANAQRRAVLKARIAATRKELDRRTQNAARQPVLHAALEQDRLVRPRLLPEAAPSAPKEVSRP